METFFDSRCQPRGGHVDAIQNVPLSQHGFIRWRSPQRKEPERSMRAARTLAIVRPFSRENSGCCTTVAQGISTRANSGAIAGMKCSRQATVLSGLRRRGHIGHPHVARRYEFASTNLEVERRSIVVISGILGRPLSASTLFSSARAERTYKPCFGKPLPAVLTALQRANFGRRRMDVISPPSIFLHAGGSFHSERRTDGKSISMIPSSLSSC